MTTFGPLTDKKLSVSIEKAVNPTLAPVKEKHVRNVIIGTYQEKDGMIFWTHMLQQPLQENRIIAWKFCHVLHKVLREGHPKFISDSQRYRWKLEDIIKSWQHLGEGYGQLLESYGRLLIAKLDFHKRNPRIPGNLQVTPAELESIGKNKYFEMSIEIFDYMDDILNLQRVVIASLKETPSNSMTVSGQCRLAPLVPCVLDAAQLYDLCVSILFKIHGALPSNTLVGHRDRFSRQFQELKKFYSALARWQYFKDPIAVPVLPENPPNFLIASDMRTYVTPIVVLPPEESLENEILAVLDSSSIDTSDMSLSTEDRLDFVNRNGSVSPETFAERESLIDYLQQENRRLREELYRLFTDHQRIVGELQSRVTQLESRLVVKCIEIEQRR